MRPGQLEKQGLDFETLHAINPKMIYASVTGFGLEGDERDKPGFDTAAFWAKSGIGWMMTPKGASPVPLRVAVGDHITGISTASGILAALLRAQKPARARWSKVPGAFRRLCRGFGFFNLYALWAHCRSRPRDEAVVADKQFLQTSDGHWLFMNSRPGEPDWPEIMRATELEHLADDPRLTVSATAAKTDRLWSPNSTPYLRVTRWMNGKSVWMQKALSGRPCKVSSRHSKTRKCAMRACLSICRKPTAQLYRTGLAHSLWR